MKKKKLIIITTLILTILLLTAIIVHFYVIKDMNQSPKYVFTIDYHYQNSSERQAINISESLDYEEFLGLPRYDEYNVPNFIDESVLNDYIKLYENINKEYDKYFNYRAIVVPIENSTIRYFVEYEAVNYSWYDSETDEWKEDIEYEPRYNVKVNVSDSIEYSYNRGIYYHYNPIIARNFSGNFEILNITENFSIWNLDGFIIEMSLNYGYYVGPTHARDLRVSQVVILDTLYNPICIIRIEKGLMLA